LAGIEPLAPDDQNASANVAMRSTRTDVDAAIAEILRRGFAAPQNDNACAGATLLSLPSLVRLQHRT